MKRTLLALAIASLTLVAFTGSAAPPTPPRLDVNVVNTPTVNVGTGGPIGVDVLTLPAGGVLTKSAESLKGWYPVIVIASVHGEATYTPATGKRVVIKSLFGVAYDANLDVSLRFQEIDGVVGHISLNPFQTELGPRTHFSIPDTTIVCPPGPITIEIYRNETRPNVQTWAYPVVTLYEMD
jgi:hypothetical protein